MSVLGQLTQREEPVPVSPSQALSCPALPGVGITGWKGPQQ